MKKIILILILCLGYSASVFSQDTSSAQIFLAVEQMPEFPGGEDSLMTYLVNNISYPKAAIDSSIGGTVYVEFVVCEDGKLCEVKTIRDIGGGCGEEAVKAVKAMPRWKPAYNGGKAVRTMFTLPIQFGLVE